MRFGRRRAPQHGDTEVDFEADQKKSHGDTEVATLRLISKPKKKIPMTLLGKKVLNFFSK